MMAILAYSKMNIFSRAMMGMLSRVRIKPRRINWTITIGRAFNPMVCERLRTLLSFLSAINYMITAGIMGNYPTARETKLLTIWSDASLEKSSV